MLSVRREGAEEGKKGLKQHEGLCWLQHQQRYGDVLLCFTVTTLITVQ